MELSEHEKKDLEKLRVIISAASLNTSQRGIILTTQGHEPSASVMIEPSMLRKLIRNAMAY